MNLPMTRSDMEWQQHRINRDHPDLPQEVKDFIDNLVESVQGAYEFVFFFEQREGYKNLGKYLRAALEQDKEEKAAILQRAIEEGKAQEMK